MFCVPSQAFGNKEVSGEEFARVKRTGALSLPSSELPYPIPTFDRKKAMVVEDEVMLEARLLHLISSSQDKYINTEVLNLLLSLGWQQDVKVDIKLFFQEYVIMPPWGRRKYDEGGRARQLMSFGKDVFHDIAECIKYIRIFGIREATDNDFAAAQEKGRSRKGVFSGNDTDAMSKCSESTTATAATKNTTGTAKSASAPSTKGRGEVKGKGVGKAAEIVLNDKKGTDDTKSSKSAMSGDSAKGSAPVAQSGAEADFESIDNDFGQNTQESSLFDDDDMQQQEVEEEVYVDPYPFLADDGPEGDIKHVLVSESFGGYKFPHMKQPLEQLGWNFCVLSSNTIQKEYIIAPPWTTKNLRADVPVDTSLLKLGRDYFLENRSVVAYLEKYGNRKVNDSEFVVEDEGGRRARRATSMPAPPPAAPAPPKTQAFAVPKGQAKKRSTTVSAPNAKTASSTSGTASVDTARPRQKKARAGSVSSLISAIDVDTEVDVVTLSQVISSLAEDEKANPVVLPEVDRGCSREIKILVKLATTVPRLDLSKAQDVWGVLKEHTWISKYCSFIIGVDIVFLRPHVSLTKANWQEYQRGKDYFCSESEVQAFIKDQIIARGRDYQTLVDRAHFAPYRPRSPDEESDDEESDSTGDEELHFTHKLPRRELRRSADSPYEVFSGNFDDRNDVSDFENDDVPSYSVRGASAMCTPDDDDTEWDEVREEDPDIAETNSRQLRNGSDDVGNKRPLSALQRAAECRSDSSKKARTFNSLSSMKAPSTSEEDPAQVVQTLGSVLSRVKTNLSPSHLPRTVIGRENEFKELHTDVSDLLAERRGGTILVAGQPGQGKTLTTRLVLETISNDSKAGLCPNFHSSWIDGSTMQGGFRELCRVLSVDPCGGSEESARTTLRSHLLRSATPTSKGGSARRQASIRAASANPMQIIVVDEIDLLPRNIMSFLKSMAASEEANVILIGLTNDSSGGSEVDKEILFEVYEESTMMNILTMLTEGLLDDKAASMIVKCSSLNGQLLTTHDSYFDVDSLILIM